MKTKKVDLTSSNLSIKKLAELRHILPEAFVNERTPSIELGKYV